MAALITIGVIVGTILLGAAIVGFFAYRVRP
jgi:hypothetical protein